MSTRQPKKRSPAPGAHLADTRPSTPPRTKIVDVAHAAGVSITTVSHALNGRGQVDPKTREAVQRVAQRLGYRPNRNAQQLRGGASNVIALLSSMPFAVAGGPSRLGFMMEIAAVAASVALERGLALILVPPSPSGTAALDGVEIDGAIVIEPAQGDAQLAHLTQRNVPVVTIGRQAGARSQHPCVDLHAQDTTWLLLEHLRAEGARRIALVTGQQHRSPYAEAVAAYESYAQQKRMKKIFVTVDENGGEEAGRLAALELLELHPEIDAICAPVDAFAVGVAQALRELDRAAPDDVMLATRYDGLRARECQPPLTALDLHLETVAVQAIELLLEHMRGATERRVVDAPPAELIVRLSTRRA